MSTVMHHILSGIAPFPVSIAVTWIDNRATPVSAITLSLAALLIVVAAVARSLVLRLRSQASANQRLKKALMARHRAGRAARAAEASLQETICKMPLGIFQILNGEDGNGRIIWLGGDPSMLFGIDAGDIRSVRDRVHVDDALVFDQLLSAGRGMQRPFSLDLRAFGSDGLGWVRAVVIPRPLGEGGIGAVGYFVDTSELNAHNEALRIARDVAERASKTKADFLATMSHEIRTPMNGIIGMLELLGRTPIDAEQKELLHAVEDSAGVLVQVLNDILDFSKLESGDLRLDETPLDPRVLIDNTVGIMAARAREKGLDVHLAIDGGVADCLRGDGTRLRQILLNLLGNAVKFTDRGSIAIRMALVGDNGASQTLRITIKDTGIGISRDKLPSLFTPFAQADISIGRRYGGTGLGLAICRHLAQLMGGTVDLRSEPDEGTTAVFEVQLAVLSRGTATPEGLRGRHAVVRLSDADTAAALSEYLRSLSMTVELMVPSQPLREGMAASLLFVDEADTESEASISARVIVVTHNAPRATSRTLDDGRLFLGANPLSWQSLVRTCLSALELPVHPVPESGDPEGEVSIRRGHILVAEDHPVSQKLILRQLATLGLTCDVVDNGLDAFEALDGYDYDLLLTDCNMPVMSGYELATAWREHEMKGEATRRLPIIAMTANVLAGEAARVRDAGMDDVISKPLQLLPLSQKIDQWLPPRPEPGPPILLAWGAVAPTKAGPDQGAGLCADLLQDFSIASRDDLTQLRLSVEREDATAVLQTLHRLLGALQLFDDGPLLSEGRRLFEMLNTEPADPGCLEEAIHFSEKLEEWLLEQLSLSRE